MSAKRDDHAAMILFIKTSGKWDVTSKCNLPTLPKKKRMHLSTAFKAAAKFSKNWRKCQNSNYHSPYSRFSHSLLKLQASSYFYNQPFFLQLSHWTLHQSCPSWVAIVFGLKLLILPGACWLYSMIVSDSDSNTQNMASYFTDMFMSSKLSITSASHSSCYSHHLLWHFYGHYFQLFFPDKNFNLCVLLHN